MLDLVKKLFGIEPKEIKSIDKEKISTLNENNSTQNVHVLNENVHKLKDGQHDIQQNNSSVYGGNPFIDNRLHLDYQVKHLIDENKALRKQRIALTGLVMLSMLGSIYLGAQSKTESIVTMVDDKGQRIQPVNLREMKDIAQRDKILSKIIEEALLNLRTITPDKQLQHQLLQRTLTYVAKDSQAYKAINNTFMLSNSNSPYNLGQKYMVTPVIKSVMAQNTMTTTDKTPRASFMIEWREKVHRLDGTYVKTDEYKGTFIFDIITPENEADVTRNPFGIQINSIQVVPVRIIDEADDSKPMHNATSSVTTN